MRLGANCVDALLRAMPASHFLDIIGNRAVDFIEIDDFGASRLRQSEPLRYIIDGNDAGGALHECAFNAKLADRATSPHRDNVAGFDLAIRSGHPTGWKDVAEKESLLIGHSARNDDRRNIGIGDADVLGLTAGVSAG